MFLKNTNDKMRNVKRVAMREAGRNSIAKEEVKLVNYK
jgi:hypothetical protein